MKRPIQWFIVCALVILSSVINTCSVIAGEGNGNGSGGGQNSPLTLIASFPVDGQKDFKTSGDIVLTFSKNVINASVRDKNKTQFKLSTADGINVPIEVKMADDQMEPEKNQTVIIKSLQELKASTVYTLNIASELKSKSGITLEKPVTIKFTTAKSADTITETIQENSSAAASSTKQEHNNWGIIAIGVLVLAIILTILYLNSRRKN